MSIGKIEITQGGEGEALTLTGETLHIVINRAYAPGAPISMSLSLADETLALQGRTIASKRRPDGSFDVRLRLVNFTRDARARLCAQGQNSIPRSR